MKKFILAGEQNATILYEGDTADTPGLKRISRVVSMDIKTVSGQSLDVKEECSKELDELLVSLTGTSQDVILVGVLSAGGAIDALVKAGFVDASLIQNKKESYQYTLLFIDENGKLHNISDFGKKTANSPSICKYVWVVSGSERIGALYGLLEISKRAGVSDWCYWADVPPVKKEQIEFSKEEIAFVSKEPSVKLRGFFMNDEWPSLGNWVSNTFGDFNVDFYEQVFVLLLRLRGNFLWPAMWSASFPIDGALGNTTEKNPLANAILADELGITMSTSHHEPLMRASEEWDKVKTTENNVGYGKDWNYFVNAQGLHRYWDDGVARNAPFKNLYTLGMRGERDSKIMGDDATMQDNVDLLKNTIMDQKGILKAHGLADAPKVLALYKEVEDYYYGDETTKGLSDWEELDDVMLLLSDDNFANVRTLPTKQKKERKAGWGLYYHFDYHGGPISYEWVNSTALEKVWDQMALAYEYGIRDLWVVNVGDLRPQELPLSYFLTLAYDFESWGSSAPNRIDEFINMWVKEQFPGFCVEICEKIARVLCLYTHMNANRRPEVVWETTFSTTKDYEAGHELEIVYEIDSLCDEIWKQTPENLKASVYSLVVFPACASANIRKMMIYAAYHDLYAKEKNAFANVCNELTKKAIEKDKELVRYYNEEMANGKWKGMMMSNHVGFHRWNDEGWAYPTTNQIVPENVLCAYCEENEAAVFVKENEETKILWTDALGVTQKEKKLHVTVLGTADEELVLDGIPDCLDMIVTPKFDGESLVDEDTLLSANAVECVISLLEGVSVYEDMTVSFEVSCNHKKIKINIPVKKAARNKMILPKKIECGGKLVLEASDVTQLAVADLCDSEKQLKYFQVIKRYGKTKDTLRMEPVYGEITSNKQAPKAYFEFYICEPGTYQIDVQFGPSNPIWKGYGQCFGLLLDQDAPTPVNRSVGEEGIFDSLPDGFVAGDYNDYRWNQGVLDNIRTVTFEVTLLEGVHEFTYFGVDAGVLLQRIVLTKK